MGALPTATDCLFILRVAVAVIQCLPICVCDVNGDLVITATDALICLRKAVGIDLPLACPCFGSTTTTMPVTTTTIPGLETGACCTQLGCGVVERFFCEFCPACVYLGPSDLAECTPSEIEQCAILVPTTTTTTTTTLPPVVGACCASNGCIISPAARCPGIYLGDRAGGVTSCDADDRAACEAMATTTTTIAPAPTTTTTTSTTLPPMPMGKCCTGTRCDIVTEQECLAGGGEYQGDGTVCSLADLLSCMIR